jgi:hypothetical protein
MAETALVTKRTGMAAGIGALLGFAIGGPVGLGAGVVLGGVLAHKTDRPRGELTPRRQLMFQRAMESVKDPVELRRLGDAFAGESLPEHAQLLYKRAGLRELPEDIKAKRRMIFRKAMCSDNVQAIRGVALAFAREGAIDAGKVLKEHADAVEAAHTAGKSSKPQDRRVLEAFADKLEKAIIHFGSQSKQAAGAARNLLNAQGKLVSQESVQRLCVFAAKAIAEEQATITATRAQVQVDEGDTQPAEDEQVETQPKSDEPTGAIEPAVVGPQPAQIEEKTSAQPAGESSDDIPIIVEAEVVEAATIEAEATEQAIEDEAAEQRVRVAPR